MLCKASANVEYFGPLFMTTRYMYHKNSYFNHLWSSQVHNKGMHLIDFTLGGRGTVCLSHVVLGDYIIHIFIDEIHIGKECNAPPAITNYI